MITPKQSGSSQALARLDRCESYGCNITCCEYGNKRSNVSFNAVNSFDIQYILQAMDVVIELQEISVINGNTEG